MKKIKIEVTELDISKGYPTAPRSCPIALAITRQVPNLDVQVMTTSVEFTKNNFLGINIPLPEKVTDFIRAVDNPSAGVCYWPFSFEMEVPDDDDFID